MTVPTIELANGQRQLISLPERPEPTAAARDRAAAANEIGIDAVKKLCGGEQPYRFMLDHALLGPVYRRGNKRTQLFAILNPLATHREEAFHLRDDVARGFAQIRRVAASLSPKI